MVSDLDLLRLKRTLHVRDNADPQVVIAEGIAWMLQFGASVEIERRSGQRLTAIVVSARGTPSREFIAESFLEAVYLAIDGFPPQLVMYKSLGMTATLTAPKGEGP